tara:strand:+ start:366 stop:662 length:297 start_codon:yes stop_codon:yes gene_type:complete
MEKRKYFRASKDHCGEKTKYDNLGKEPLEVSKEARDIMDYHKALNSVKSILGLGLYIEWKKECGLMSQEDYSKIRVKAKSNKRFTIDENILDITTDEA